MSSDLTWDEHTTSPATRIVEVRGRLVFPDSRLLGQRLSHLVRRGTRGLVLDLSRVTDMDASIVGLLLATARQLGWRGGHVAVVTEDAAILQLLSTTGLDSVLEVATSQAD